ncbi:MAG: DMT family transporter [Planctomycetota bacterium]|nr:MAG: DMT family transporter [Planctomycetota bacterium]
MSVRATGDDAAHVQPLGPLSAFLAILTAMLWGGTAVGSRIAVDAVPPLALGGLRFAMAALFMLVWCRMERSPLGISRPQWRPVLICGLLLFVQIGTFNLGTEHSTASHATLFINTFIFWVAAIEHFITHDHRLNARQLAGLIVAAAGVVILVVQAAGIHETPESQTDSATLFGDALLLTSALLLAIKIVYTKRAVRTVTPGTLIFWHDVVGVVLFSVASAVWEDVGSIALTTETALALLYIGVVISGFCFAAQAWLLKRHSASAISVFSFSTPVFGVAAAVIFRGDVLSPWLFASGLCVAAGIALVTIDRSNRLDASD